MPDLHSAPLTERVSDCKDNGVEAVLVRLRRSKTDETYALHIYPTTHWSSGIQIEGLLAYAGFEAGNCSFLPWGKCMSKAVDPTFDLTAFCEVIPKAHSALNAAEKHLEACGIPIPGTYWHKNMVSSGRWGDGHTAAEWNQMKESEDAAFHFLFTWIKGPSAKGWTTHYRPKHLPLTENVASAFEFLDIRRYAE